MDALLNVLLPHAHHLLSAHGELYPFGAVMSIGGEAKFQAGHDGAERPESQALIDLLTAECA